MDLVAGLLFAVDFLFPTSVGERAGKWLVSLLPKKADTLKPLKPKTFRMNALLTCMAVVGLVVWAIVKGESSTLQMIQDTIGFVVGLVVGVIVVTSITFGFEKLLMRFRPESNSSLIWPLTFVASVVLGCISLYALRLATGELSVLAAPIVTFVLTLWILPCAIGYAGFIRGYIDATPEKPVYALSRIGLLIFVASKIIELYLAFHG